MKCKKILVILLFLYTFIAGFILGCQDSERTQARKLVVHLRSIAVKDPYETRRLRVIKLETLKLSDHKLIQIRDRCVEAHRALLAAEKQQVEARKALDVATAKDPNRDIKADDALNIAQAIERSNEELKRAKETFPSCEEAIRKLELRFASDNGTP